PALGRNRLGFGRRPPALRETGTTSSPCIPRWLGQERAAPGSSQAWAGIRPLLWGGGSRRGSRREGPPEESWARSRRPRLARASSALPEPHPGRCPRAPRRHAHTQQDCGAPSSCKGASRGQCPWFVCLCQDWGTCRPVHSTPSDEHNIVRTRRGFQVHTTEPSPGTNSWIPTSVRGNLPDFCTPNVMMTLQRTHTLLLLLLLTLLGLAQPSFGQDRMYQRFLRQHVHPQETGGNDSYCNLMMQRRKMTSHHCKPFNTFIHEDIWNIRSICSTTSIRCKNGKMNCHEGVVKVTDCKETGSSRAPNCRYRAAASTRRVVIACGDNMVSKK
uniref:Ribonuclease 4 n=1 Tax=Oryctolagus cuniculus TaxID=9986 RepID=A0A5F9DK26_RABIT